MTRGPRAGLTHATPIAELGGILRAARPIVVGPGDSLEHLAELAVAQPRCRIISVVDASGALVGLVPIRALVNDMLLTVIPEQRLSDITDLDAVLRYAGDLGVRTASDIMVAPVSLETTDSVRDAFERMYEAGLNGLPVVDADRRVTGYLDQLELLLAWLRGTASRARRRRTAIR